jgi:hypothetical protein
LPCPFPSPLPSPIHLRSLSIHYQATTYPMPFVLYRRFAKNPYTSPIEGRTATIYRPNDYYIQLINSLQPDAIRVFYTIAAHRLSNSDQYYLHRAELRKYLPRKPQELMRSITMLIGHNLMQKAGKSDHYYINPAVFCSVSTLFQ